MVSSITPHGLSPFAVTSRGRQPLHLVDLVVGVAVLASQRGYSPDETASIVLSLTEDPAVLARARLRVEECHLRAPSPTGHRAERALRHALHVAPAGAGEPAAATPSAVGPPAQRRSADDVEPACVGRDSVVLAGSMDSVALAAKFVEHRACEHHLPTGTGPVVLLAHELMVQAVRRRRSRPVRLSVECDATALTVAVHISGLGVGAFGPHGRKRLGTNLIEAAADEWGVDPWGKGLRLWGRIRAPEGGRADAGLRATAAGPPVYDESPALRDQDLVWTPRIEQSRGA